ncbi:MAG: DUF3047 domain-containing protein [Candidatus Dadabacteria bacterium]|nr:MAG: DUF3047 domain-containing protein [Candidatus Dadabacteria bacterium]
MCQLKLQRVHIKLIILNKKPCGYKVLRNVLTFSAVIVFTAWSSAAAQPVIYDEFKNLHNWAQLYFPKVKRHSRYTIVRDGRDGFALQAESDRAASALVMKKSFNPEEYPTVSWRWKVAGVIPGADGRKKSGDDYPLRIYIIFDKPKKKPGFFSSLGRRAAELVYGRLPYSSLNYVWGNLEDFPREIRSPYTDGAGIIVLRRGNKETNHWMEEKVNLAEDYGRIFKEELPLEARIAIMTDSDNTGSKTKAWLDWITVFNEGEVKR